MKFVILALALIGAASAAIISPFAYSSPYAYHAGAPVVSAYSAGAPVVSAYSAGVYPYSAGVYPAAAPVFRSVYGAPATVDIASPYLRSAAIHAPVVNAYSTGFVSPAVAPVAVAAWKKKAAA